MSEQSPFKEPAEMQRITDTDWLYATATAIKTQDVVQRKLLEIISRVTGRALPNFPQPGSAA
jgi:hypothetical protein